MPYRENLKLQQVVNDETMITSQGIQVKETPQPVDKKWRLFKLLEKQKKTYATEEKDKTKQQYLIFVRGPMFMEFQWFRRKRRLVDMLRKMLYL